ncbi:MAG: hypothetical protein K2Q06_03575 [Parvularculaceae bacterium]|nr:hypothetical protein [Parvularculaceae bacterium]
MPFHPVDRGPSYGSLTPPTERRISARRKTTGGHDRILFRVSRDVVGYLNLGVGDYVTPMIGSDEDFGSFAIQRGNERTGFRLGVYNASRMLTFSMTASRFMPIPELTTVHFRCDFESDPRRVVARPAVLDTPTARLRITARAPLTFA